MNYQLKDAIRWVQRPNKDGKTIDIILQVLVVETNLDQNMQGTVNEKWVDVLFVTNELFLSK